MNKQKALEIVRHFISLADVTFPEEYSDVADFLGRFKTECLPTLPEYEEKLLVPFDKKKIYLKIPTSFVYRDGEFYGWYVIVKEHAVSIRFHEKPDDDSYLEVFLSSVEGEDDGLICFITNVEKNKPVGGKSFGISKNSNLVFSLDDYDHIKAQYGQRK